MKKQILTLAIIATLPLTAMADNPVVSVGPAAVPANGTAVVATANPPYQTLTPTNDEKSHIASTAYVKGAYNDAIAAVNKVATGVEAKQDEIVNIDTGNAMQPIALGMAAWDDIVRTMFHDGANTILYDNELASLFVSGTALAAAINTLHGISQVEVYTTWDNDNASRGVYLNTMFDFE